MSKSYFLLLPTWDLCYALGIVLLAPSFFRFGPVPGDGPFTCIWVRTPSIDTHQLELHNPVSDTRTPRSNPRLAIAEFDEDGAPHQRMVWRAPSTKGADTGAPIELG
jgi:hypothetical protein